MLLHYPPNKVFFASYKSWLTPLDEVRIVALRPLLLLWSYCGVSAFVGPFGAVIIGAGWGAGGFGLWKGKIGKGADEAQKKVEKDAAIKKQVDDYVEKRKNPDGIKKIDPKQFDSRGQKSESPKATETETKTETKPKKMHPI